MPGMSATGALTLTTDVAATELGHAVHELVTRQIDIDQFVDRFLVAHVYALCPVSPGLFIMSRPGAAPIVPVWSTIRALRHVMGGFGWLACTGAELVAPHRVDPARHHLVPNAFANVGQRGPARTPGHHLLERHHAG